MLSRAYKIRVFEADLLGMTLVRDMNDLNIVYIGFSSSR